MSREVIKSLQDGSGKGNLPFPFFKDAMKGVIYVEVKCVDVSKDRECLHKEYIPRNERARREEFSTEN